MNKGNLYIISAPSGAGKTSLVKQLIIDLEHIMVSVSHTTRIIRVGEVEGNDYFFITPEIFKGMIAQQDFLEHAQVFDNFYGTARQSVDQQLAKGMDVILEIDWQGAEQVKKMYPQSATIFILPPSIDVLRQRLEGRGQDSDDIIQRRMQDAVSEMSHCREFEYLIVNDDFNCAVSALKSIVIAHRLKKDRQLTQLAGLVHALE